MICDSDAPSLPPPSLRALADVDTAVDAVNDPYFACVLSRAFFRGEVLIWWTPSQGECIKSTRTVGATLGAIFGSNAVGDL